MFRTKKRASWISRGFIVLIGLFRKLRPRLWRRFYNRLATQDNDNELLFMNYGFDDPNVAPLDLSPDMELYRYPAQLYEHVINNLVINNKHLVEVGCGRGGGAAWISTQHKPAHYIAIDVSDKAIEWCQTFHSINNLEFTQGQADKLPLADNSVDVLINVESSHCYPSLPAFVKEVARVLKPGGHFAICDLRAQKTHTEFRQYLANNGLDVIHEQDITSNVLAALDAMSKLRENSIKHKVPRRYQRMMQDFVALKGTALYEMLKSGKLIYMSHITQKGQ